jgi:predicted flap endonuclease-1-like 5' DNA nuclease
MEMDFSNYFDGFNTQDSYAILFIMLIAFLFGLLLGYLLRTRRVILLKREVKALKKTLSETQTEMEALKEQIDLKDADLKKASFDHEELEAKIIRLEGEKGKLYNQVLNLTSDYERLQTSSKTYTDTIEDLQNQIVGLKAQNNQLNEEFEEDDDALNDMAQMQSTFNATRNRLELLENKLNRLEQENNNLKDALIAVKDEQEALKVQKGTIVVASTPEGGAEADETSEEPDIATGEKTIVKKQILLDDGDKDDLTRINGIGPFLEKKLNSIGIFTYRELGELNDQGVAQVTKAIGYFEGRIQKDDWVGQAKKLAQAKAENPNAFVSSSRAPIRRKMTLRSLKGLAPRLSKF